MDSEVKRVNYVKPLSSGTFCEVFNLGNGQVLKAFTAIRSEVAPESDARLVPQMLFNYERRAYTTLQKLPELEVFAPRFYGPANPIEFELESERTFVNGCGLLLEFIPGNDIKLAHLPSELLKRAEDVIERIRTKVPLGDPWDASCFVPGTRAEFTIIDFATPTDRLHELDLAVQKIRPRPFTYAATPGHRR